MEMKKAKLYKDIVGIIFRLREEFDWGGVEDDDGNLLPGTPNWNKAWDEIDKLFDEMNVTREVCKHVKIINAVKDFDCCEYVNTLEIECLECKKTYVYSVLIN